MKAYQFNFSHDWPSMYDKNAREEKARRIIKVLEDYFGKNRLKELTILDIGSSTGIIDNILAPNFKKVVCVDIDEGGINYAKKTFKKPNLKFYIKDAMNLDLPDNSFDVVICTQVYEHVPDAKKLFSEIYRILKPNGVCYLAALNKLWPLEPHHKLLFLSWLPKNLADIYISFTRNKVEYEETLRTYWNLRSITSKFTYIDYTKKILQNPQKFGYNKVISSNFRIDYIVKLLSPIASFFTPTFIWLLIKKN